jgi:hypothetical protein
MTSALGGLLTIGNPRARFKHDAVLDGACRGSAADA